MNNSTTFSLERREEVATLALEKLKRQSSTSASFFISNCCYTFDPKREPYHFRFELFPFQNDYVHQLVTAIENGEDIFVEKCREMGATYTTLDVLLWFWLFVPGSNFLIGSRKEDYVDNTKEGSELTNKEESLFGKLEYTLNHLHPYFWPRGFEMKKHLNYMSLVNPQNGNVISGESANANFSRGGRQKAILMDEFAFWDNDSSAWGSTADTTNCRIVLTTPGIRLNTKAKRLRFGDDGEKITILTLPYYLDPRKTQTWLDRERTRRSAEDFAREIMINWEGSLEGIVYPEIRKAVVGSYPYNPTWQSFVSWDFGLDGVAVQYWQLNPQTTRLRLVDCYTNSNKAIPFFYPLFNKKPFITLTNGKTKELRYQYTEADLEAFEAFQALGKAQHYGDPDVEKRSILTASSTQQALGKIGIYVHTNTLANAFSSRRERTKIWLQGGIEVNETSRTKLWLEYMKSARYPRRTENSQATRGVLLPVHDVTSHHRTATEYLCVNLPIAPRQSAGPVGKRMGHNNVVPTWKEKKQGEYVAPNFWDPTKLKRVKQRSPFKGLPK